MRRGPKPRFSRWQVVEAAIECGGDDVTMQAVARRLGTSASALYRYFATHDELVVAALREVLRRHPLPSVDRGWRRFLEDEAALRWTLLTRWKALALADPNRFDTAASNRLAQMVETLLAAGFDVDSAVLAVDSVIDLIHDGATQAAALPRDGRPMPPNLAVELAAYQPAVRDAVERIIADPAAHVRRKLALVLDGIERHLERQLTERHVTERSDR